MIPRPPRSTLFPTRRSSDLHRLGTTVFRDGTRRWREDHRLLRPETSRPPPAARAFHPSLRSHPACPPERDRKSTRLNSSHSQISYAVFCLKKKKKKKQNNKY